MMLGLFRLRLTAKLVLVVTGVSLLAVFIAGLSAHLASGPAFQQLVTTEAQSHFRTDVVEYYHQSGNVDGIQGWLSQRLGEPSGRTPGEPLPPPPPGVVRFGLANPAGVVVLPGDGYTNGQALAPDVIRRGTPILEAGHLIGTILPSPTPVPYSEEQQTYAHQITAVLALAGLGGALAAMLIGVAVAGNIVRPIKGLTNAAREVAGGRLAQTVPVRGKDELAELSAAFNMMSQDLACYEQARRQMVADIAHELRTPLTTINGYVEAMRDGELEPTPERLDSVCRQAHRMTKVIEDLRLLALADVGALPVERARISLRELVVQSVGAYEVRAGQHGIAIRAEVDQQVPDLEADPGRIQQVIEILVNNALRHTQQGEIVVSASMADGDAVINVSDTGSGIEPEALPRLFERFYRGDSARARDSQGSGLGLAIAKAIVTAHDGTISVASQLARGTVFTIRLPIGQAAAAE